MSNLPHWHSRFFPIVPAAPGNFNMLPRITRSALLRAAVLCASAVSLASLTACESPFIHETQTSSGFSNALLTRAMIDNGTLPANAPMETTNGGVRELSRVDSPGPSPVNSADPAAADATSAIIPAGTAPASPSAPVSFYPDNVAGSPQTFGDKEPVIFLSLQDAIDRAVTHNLAVKVEAFNPGIKEEEITEAESAFDAVIFGQTQWNLTNEPSTQQFANSNLTNVTTTVGIKKVISSGATVSVGINEIYQDVKNPAIPLSVNSSNEAQLNITIQQPLLRGFGASTIKANIYLAQRDQRIAQTNFRKQVITQLESVEEAYYNLIQARVAVDTQTRLLQNTQETLDRLNARVQIDADKVTIKQGEAAVEQRRAELITARSVLRNTSDQLKALINDPSLDLRSNLLILPSDRPVVEPVQFNVADAIATALNQRSEMQEARLNIEKSDIIIDFAKNDLLPQADLTFTTQSTGIDSGFGGALFQTYNAPGFIDYGVGIRFEIPIGNREKEAALQRHRLEKSQAVMQMLAVAQQVISDVKISMRNMLTSYSELQAQEASRRAFGDELNAILVREKVGEKLTPEFLQLKLDTQQRLADAELSTVQALVNYNIALAKLEQAKGTLLDYDRIAIDSTPPKSPKYTSRAWFYGEAHPSTPPAATSETAGH